MSDIEKIETTEKVKEDIEKIEVTKKSKKDIKKTEVIMIPKGVRGEENFQLFKINGRNYQVQKGVPVEVPCEVAEIWRHSQNMQAQAEAYLDQVEKPV
ncbi:MAG: hypothetical protein HFE74_04465 [Firmicutes bacterium]|jgi:hypothetical protein|nr:hypothetical protein [Bacillota bacterium]